MASYAVRFKGVLFKLHLERLEAAGIPLESSEPAMQIGPIKTGEPINTVLVEAESDEQAIATVKAKLTPDDVNFSDWDADPA
ncbi:MAG TPA: hypothetical protein VFJ65_04270 [Solirubrobacterales bacterium]|nr:hypothetical protein [Solirubrobacterales bacterium]